MSLRLWSADDVRLAIALYVQIPFGRIHTRNPEIIALAERIGRTPSAVALKLSNLAALDETLPRMGMQNASSLDRQVWSEFFQALMTESQALPDPKNAVGYLHEDGDAPYVHSGVSLDRYGIAKMRSRQDLFRTMVVSAYDNKCAVTGIEQPELLVAAHIMPWAKDANRRLDPTNGICLNRLHERAFDEGLVAFEDDGRILFSPQMRPETHRKLRNMSTAETIRLPRRFLPDLELLRYHRENCFRRQAA